MSFIRICAALLLLTCVVFKPMVGHAQSSVSYESCDSLTDEEFSAAIDTLTRESLEDELLNADYESLVASQWQNLYMDRLIDRLVNRAIDDARDENGYLRRLIASYHPGIAEDIAETVVQRVFEDPAFLKRYDDLSVALSRDLEEQISQATMNARDSASQCLRVFLDSNYATTVSDAVAHFVTETHIRLEPELDVDRQILDFRATMAGAATLVMRRTLQRIVLRAVRRVAGSIAGRISSAAVPIIGWALIAYDLLYGPESVLNDVQDQLRSEQTKQGMRRDIADSLATSVERESVDASRLAADTLNSEWVAFRDRYRQILDLSRQETAFRAYIETVPADEFESVARTADLVTRLEQTTGLVERADDGSLDNVRNLTDAGLKMVDKTGDIDLALLWTAQAGKDLPQVLDLELHEYVAPDLLTNDRLQRLLALGDKATISRFFVLPEDLQTRLLEQPPAEVKSIVTTLEPEPLNQYALYLQKLDTDGAQTLTRLVLDDPRRFALLENPGLRESVVDSLDQSRAIEMAARTGTTSKIAAYTDDLGQWTSGRVGFGVFWSVHAMMTIVLLLLLGLVLAYIARGLLPGRRRASGRT